MATKTYAVHYNRRGQRRKELVEAYSSSEAREEFEASHSSEDEVVSVILEEYSY